MLKWYFKLKNPKLHKDEPASISYLHEYVLSGINN